MKRLLLLLALVTLALTAACGSDDDPAVSGGATGESHNDADIAFAQGMIPHHEQAVEMAEMALEKSENPEITDLAARIVDAQGPEIEKLQGWLEEWGEDEAADDGGGHGSMGGSDDSSGGGMMSDGDMETLEKATGEEFDRMFLEMMIEHHKGAIEMAEAELEDGEFADAQAMARDIIDAQQSEIEEMEGLLEGSSTSTTAP